MDHSTLLLDLATLSLSIYLSIYIIIYITTFPPILLPRPLPSRSSLSLALSLSCALSLARSLSLLHPRRCLFSSCDDVAFVFSRPIAVCLQGLMVVLIFPFLPFFGAGCLCDGGATPSKPPAHACQRSSDPSSHLQRFET